VNKPWVGHDRVSGINLGRGTKKIEHHCAIATVVKVVRHFSPRSGKNRFSFIRAQNVCAYQLLYIVYTVRDFGKQAPINIRRLIAGKDIMRLTHGNKL